MKAVIILICSLSTIFSSSNSLSMFEKDTYKHQLFEEMPGSDYGNTLKLTSSQIPITLNSQVSNFSWSIQSTVSVSDAFDGEPRNISEQNTSEPISTAKQNQNIVNSVGCGPLALYSMFEYLADYFWLDNLRFDANRYESYVNLASNVITSTKTYSIDNQTLTSPKDMVYSFDKVMTSFDYNNILSTTIYKELQNDISNTIDMFKSSIDKGLPIIWWCHLDNNAAYNHYLVIYAYENWTAIDQNSNEITYPVFKVRYNLPNLSQEYYIFPEMLSYVSGAIVFDYHKSLYRFEDDDITSQQYYPYSPVQYSLSNNGQQITGSILRTGYITDTENVKHLVMSPRRINAGQSYLTFHFPNKVRHLYAFLSLWSSSEYLDYIDDSFYVEILDINNNWVKSDTIPIHLLTANRHSPKYYHFTFLTATSDIRIVANSSAVGDRNKGRLVLHNLVFVESLEEPCEKKFINKYAETESVSSNTIVYIAGCDKDFVEAMGISLSASSSNPNYYTYLATYGGNKRITNIRRLYNDLESLSFILSEIEELALSYGIIDTKNEILAYIRTMSIKYTIEMKTFPDTDLEVNMWFMMAGAYDSSLFYRIDADYSHGLFYRDYLFPFLTLPRRNHDLHGLSQSNPYIDYYGSCVSLIDPFYSYNAIDLIHMFASIDAIYASTGTSNLLITFFGFWHRDIGSWAGDLQDGSNENDLEASLLNGESFGNIFFKYENETACSLSDMLADIDAMNIAKIYFEDTNYTFSQCFTEYYAFNENDYHGRFADFKYSMTIDNQGFSGTTSDIFEKKVFLFLGADRDNSGLDLINNSLFSQLKYGLILGPSKTNLLMRRLLAYSYIDYVYREMEN
ncbi:MAG: hypothetical protein EOM77_01100 [Bacteroidia bacterium]|nr:hypothetical protein [Bacteroidia bacterium]